MFVYIGLCTYIPYILSDTACESTEYQCSEGRCLERAWLCDGHADCSTSEDEQNCST